MANKKRKPLGKSPAIPEVEQEEAATPDSKDLQRADELSTVHPVLQALWEAKPFEEKNDERSK